MHHDAEACVRLVPIFTGLSDAAIQAVAGLVKERHIEKDGFIFMAGSAADTLIIVASGQAKVVQETASGREQLIRVLNSGDFDGQAGLFTAGTRETTAQALTDTDVCVIERADFQQLLVEAPAVARNMLNVLGQRVVQLENQSAQTLTASVAERLANYLIETSAELSSRAFKLPLAKKDLAAYLGTSPESISRKLTAFSKAGLINQSGRNHIELVDVDGLMLVKN
ncbi:Crp/Fnr family transcriptional regulator [Secundilactobacillus kimchicus]|uniref:Crp/Fnr family transcriptional regulator n=1 Tax=Secundilactobacillus kimchicus TaxID=528209 RepID=UPI0006D1C740|nr:Crp/Fnr family transcriptional regulator [Secundilactobacillus kimchicus]MBT9672051.1 cyclic nucleotide-binding domain-containing protein [Secundilactobacillus kimchicus]